MHSVCEKNLLSSHFLLSNSSLVRARSILIQCFGDSLLSGGSVETKTEGKLLFDIYW